MTVDDDPLSRLETALQRIAFSVQDRPSASLKGASDPVQDIQSIGAHIDLLVARIDDVLARCASEDEAR